MTKAEKRTARFEAKAAALAALRSDHAQAASTAPQPDALNKGWRSFLRQNPKFQEINKDLFPLSKRQKLRKKRRAAAIAFSKNAGPPASRSSPSKTPGTYYVPTLAPENLHPHPGSRPMSCSTGSGSPQPEHTAPIVLPSSAQSVQSAAVPRSVGRRLDLSGPQNPSQDQRSK
jgi:hypothetical protein